jgi:hypothetical protein
MADDIDITPGTGKTVATDEVSGKHHQRVKRSVGADGSATDYMDRFTRSDAHTATGNGTALDMSAQGAKFYSLQVKGTGAAATAWEVILQGSLDGTNWTTLLTHRNDDSDPVVASADGQTIYLPVPTPMLHIRSRCVSVTLGSASNVTATIVGMP